ncbi:hypothetical protein D3C81_2033140 [compost metagenome]
MIVGGVYVVQAIGFEKQIKLHIVDQIKLLHVVWMGREVTGQMIWLASVSRVAAH